MYRGWVPVRAASSAGVAGPSASALYRPRWWPTTTLPALIVAPRSPTKWCRKSMNLSWSSATVVLPGRVVDAGATLDRAVAETLQSRSDEGGEGGPAGGHRGSGEPGA